MQRYYDVFAFRIGGDGSQQVGVLFNDITERKRAEVALRRSEQRLNRLISMSPAAIFSVSLEPPFGVTFIGDNVTEQTGWLPSDFTGDPSFWLNHVHPEDQARVGEIVSRLVTDGKYAYDYRFRHQDGSWRWMREEAHVVHAGDGAPCEAIGICMDITTEHREAEKRKERGLRRRDALVREVHHRIKNSLQGVVGLLRQFAGDYPDVSPLMDKAVAQMQAVAVAHGLQARALRGGILLREIVPAIAEATEQMIRVPLCVEIAAEVNAQLLLPENEAVPIALVLNELMLNAAKCAAAQPQPDAVRVTLSVTSEGTRVAVSNPGRLPPGFDFPRGRGVGTGLKLVRSLLPQEGVTLVYSQSGGRVHAAVELSAPAIAITPQVELRVAEV